MNANDVEYNVNDVEYNLSSITLPPSPYSRFGKTA